MRVLVTGAGGFLGRYIAEDLIKEGHSVTNFSRSKYPELEAQGIKCIQGDISNLEDVIKACKDHNAIIHTASRVGMLGHWNDFYKANVIGCSNIIEAAKKNGIEKLVYTSSPSVVFGKESLEGVDESQPYPNEYLNSYAKTKAMGEKLILEANCKNLATVSLRPHLIFGKRDQNLIPRLLESAKQGRLKIVGDGNNKVDVIYVENASKAHIKALNNLEPNSKIAGKAYFIGQEQPVKLWDFINDILSRNSIPKITKKVPTRLAYIIGALIEIILKMLKKHDVHPPMSRFIALQLSKSHYFSHKKASEDFGFVPEIDTKKALDLTFS